MDTVEAQELDSAAGRADWLIRSDGRSAICAFRSPTAAISAASIACRRTCRSCRKPRCSRWKSLTGCARPSSRRGVRKLRLTGGEPLVRRGIMTLVGSLSRHLRCGAPRRTDADHQRLATRQICRGAQGGRRAPHQRVARYARRREIPRHYPLGRSRPGARRDRRRPGRRPEDQDQRGRAQGRQRGRISRA